MTLTLSMKFSSMNDTHISKICEFYLFLIFSIFIPKFECLYLRFEAEDVIIKCKRKNWSIKYYIYLAYIFADILEYKIAKIGL